MLIGHYAPALVLHRVRPSIPLWVLFLATQALDVLWGLFVLTGVEHVRMVPGFTESNSLDLYDMPYSHSVVGESSNIISSTSNQYGTFVTRESLFAGPGGLIKLQSTWQVLENAAQRLITAIPFGGP